MNCYDIVPDLGTYLDGALPINARRSLEDHLEGCRSCSLELTRLQRIEQLLRGGIYQEPPDSYWAELPKQISRRLRVAKKPSALFRMMHQVNHLFGSTQLRFALAGGFAVLAAVWLYTAQTSRTADIVRHDDPVIAYQPADSPAPSKKLLEAAQDKGVAATEERIQTTESIDVTPAEVQSIPLSHPTPTGPTYELAIAAMNGRPPVFREVTPEIRERLVPIPTLDLHATIVTRNLVTEKSAELPAGRSYALKNTGPVSKQAITADIAPLPEDLGNSYAEALWFVQGSNSMYEKRNIWFSYLEREENDTYRSLGVYHLAMVLHNVAETSKEPEEAQQALAFFREHKASLLVQMGEVRYGAKADALVQIIGDDKTKE